MASPQRPIISPCLQEHEAKGGYVKVKQQTVGTCAIDVATGLLAPMLVAPLVAVVDVAIINSVTGDKTPVWDGMKNGYKKLFRTPHKFLTDPKWLKYTGLCWMVYAGTYSMANLTTSYIEANQVSSESAKMLKLVFSSTANIGLTLLKDILLVASVGNVKVPIRTRACFITRDVMTMGATFVIADEFGAWMARKFEGTLSDRWARQFATLTLPVMIQPFSTLLHLYGLNWAEKPGLTGSAMVNAIGRNYFISTASRMARIFPAIGLGSNINIALRDANFRQAERSRWI